MAVRDSESYHSGLRLLFFRQGVVRGRFFKMKESKPTLQRGVSDPKIWTIQIIESSV